MFLIKNVNDKLVSMLYIRLVLICVVFIFFVSMLSRNIVKIGLKKIEFILFIVFIMVGVILLVLSESSKIIFF